MTTEVTSNASSQPIDVESAIAAAIGSRRLLSHPFYQRWLDGTLKASELATYAAQYRYFEAQLPGFLASVLETLPDGSARDLVAANLSDELSSPAPHLELFDGFASAVGAEPTAATPATEALVSCYSHFAHAPALSAVGALAAYEVQAAEVAVSKAAGLRERYGLEETATTFWDVHSTTDLDHAAWVVEALSELAESPDDVALMAAAVSETAEAWWSFLDEREALRPVGV